MNNHRIHPVADLFPMMSDDDLRALADDIKQHGQREPIIRCNEEILDGRNRLRACEMAGVEPMIEDIVPVGGALAFIIGANLRRRHMDQSQRAMCAARLANLKVGRPRNDGGGVSQEDAAKMFGVSRALVQMAAEVLKAGDANLIDDVNRGLVAVSNAKSRLHVDKPARREGGAQVSKSERVSESLTPSDKRVTLVCREGLFSYPLLEPDQETEATADSLTRASCFAEIEFENGATQVIVVYADGDTGKLKVKVSCKRVERKVVS